MIIMQKLSRFVFTYRVPIVVFFVVISAIGFYLSTNLVVDSDLLKLLPRESDVVKRYENFVKWSSTDDVTFIVLKTNNKTQKGLDELKAAAKKLYQDSYTFPHIEDFIRFDLLSNLGALSLVLVDPSVLKELSPEEFDFSDEFKRLVNYDFSAIHDIGIAFSETLQLKDKILSDSTTTFESFVRIPSEFPENDPMILVMGIKLDGPSSDVDYVDLVIPQLRKWVKSEISEYNISFNLTGDHQATYESHKQASRDFMVTTIVSLIGIALLFYLAYSSFKVTMYIFISLATSMFTTLGLAFLIFGRLNIVTTFVNAITLGLGIDYGIHIITRLSDEVKRRRDPVLSLKHTYYAVTKPLLVSLLTTILVFILLAIIDSPAIRELGILTSVGLFVFFITMYIFLPALSIGSFLKPGKVMKIHSLDRFFYATSAVVKRYSMISLSIIVTILLIFSYIGFVSISNFSYTPPGLMSEESEMLSTLHLLERVFKADVTNSVPILADNIEQVEEISRILDENEYVEGSFSILTIFKEDSDEYMKQFKEVVRTLDRFRGNPLMEAFLKKANYYDELFVLLDESEKIESGKELIDFISETLPESLKKQFIYLSPDGKKYYIVTAYPAAHLYSSNFIKRFFDSLGELVERVEGYPRIFYYIMDIIKKVSLPVSGVAILLVFLIVSLERKNIFDGLKVTFLMIGILLSMFGIMNLIGIKTTFITIITAPLIIGIGVDSLVHMIHSSTTYNLFEAGRTLKSVTMSSATTMLAFFSFSLAEGRLLRNFGLTLTVGVFLALLVAAFAIPVLPWNKER
ncbi:exporter of the RND superfamily protein-like protein [Kosmotoga olearia TBF 19.5.1]|uniref:Exporter of the RND superfamily protein-like protein n=3 Tax=Kosmotoga TaxID=651456 RepID=C5CDU6_KOSOT|nr:exporter of the RND superfamily protein-like protein [Kosmotoga olearia TBF 19.5.1]